MIIVTTPSTICPTLIGRADHLADMHMSIERTKKGSGGLILVSGEAGIGKSCLLDEAKTYAAAQDFLLLQGNCFLIDVQCPYAPLLDLWRSFFAHLPSSLSELDATKLLQDLFPLLPELVSSSNLPFLPPDPEQEKRRLFAVMRNLLIRLAHQQPVLFIIEDLHWSDDTSLDFLHSLARISSSEPLLLLVTFRSDEAHLPLKSWLAQLDRERLAQEMRLPPLSRGEVDEMLSTIFDQHHTALDMRRFLHGELLDAIYTFTEGNPFFVEEMLNSLITSGNIFYVRGYWNRTSLQEMHIPRSIQDSVQQRIAPLSPEAHNTLTLAAVIGRRFDFTLLQQLTHLQEEHLLSCMRELLAVQLVHEESAECFAFRHALTREAIYKNLLVRERLTLHRTIAYTLTMLYTDTLEAHAGELATHFYSGEVWQKVIEFAQSAGEQALLLYTPRAAIDYFTWALDAKDRLSQTPSPPLFRLRGRAYNILGEFEHASSDYQHALEYAQRDNDHIVAWQCLIDLGFLWAGRDYTQAEPWFRKALLLAQTLDDPTIYAHSLNRVGNWHLNREQSREALDYHKQALAIFQQLQNTQGIAETLDLLGMTYYMGGDLIQGTPYYQQAISLLQKLDDHQGLTSSFATLTLRGATYQTDTMASTGSSLVLTQRDAEQALSIARAIGQRSAEAYALFQLGLCRGSQGDYASAVEAIRQSLNISEEIEHLQWQAAAHTVLGGLYNTILALPLARQHFELALELAQKSASLFWIRIATGYLASTLIQSGALLQTEQILQVLPASDTTTLTMALRMIKCASIELALAKNNPEAALALTELFVTSGSERQFGLRILQLRGKALIALGKSGDGEIVFKEAQNIAIMQEVRSQQWRIALQLGNLYLIQKRTTEATQEFSSARMLIEELSIKISDIPLREAFVQQAMALFPHQPSPQKNTRQGSGKLTAREGEIAALIAQGKSNQAIADILIVTRRTVETHIGNIMFKLGCTSRTQIAVWAVEKGLTNKSE
jgi:DNA-binding CsgD family transcriptional regulator/Tfp pilus assembly protein PilF